jgi:hypothetical protein
MHPDCPSDSCPLYTPLQLTERRAGNQAYKAGDLGTALHHYQRALAITDYVTGATAHDQAEVDRNKAAVLANMAAVYLAQKEYGAALQVGALAAGCVLAGSRTWCMT